MDGACHAVFNIGSNLGMSILTTGRSFSDKILLQWIVFWQQFY